MRRFAFMTILCLLCLNVGCKDDGTEPPPTPKNPREYTWTEDTLAYPGSFQTNMRDIWGSAPNNVYVVGHNDQNRGLMWRFDGQRWTDVKLSVTQGGTIVGAIDLAAIFGFTSSDVWAVGEHSYANPNPPPNFLDSSLVIRFDGTQWREFRTPGGRLLQSVWGSSPNDVWFGGVDATLLHFDGVRIQKDSIDLGFLPDSTWEAQITSITGSTSDDVYLLVSAAPRDTLRIFRYLLQRNGTSWNLIANWMAEEVWEVWKSPWGRLIGVGSGGVFEQRSQSWSNVLTGLAAFGITATGERNTFVVGYSGVNGISAEAYHYNGTDWFHYPSLQLRNVIYYAVWATETDVFAVGQTFDLTPQRTIVVHGR